MALRIDATLMGNVSDPGEVFTIPNQSEVRPAWATRFDWDVFARPTVLTWMKAVAAAMTPESPYFSKDFDDFKAALALTLLADSDPRPDHAGEKADSRLSIEGHVEYMTYKSHFEQKFGIPPLPENKARLNEMEALDYATDRQEPEQCHFFNIGLRRAAFPRRLIVLRNGYIGIAPPRTEAGDLVYVIMGATTPFVMRKTETEGVMSMIGECYIHGIMDGEALERADVKVEKIAIC
jgi:hypothetical protein